MAVRKIKTSWWVDFAFDHRRLRKRSPENSKAGAQAFEAALRQKLARGEPTDAPTRKPERTFKNFAWMWFEDYVMTNNKFSEQRAKRGILVNALIPFFGEMLLNEITNHHFEQFKAQQMKAAISSKTLRNRLTVMRKCLSSAHEWGQLTKSPPRVKWPKCPPPRTDYLSPEECKLILSHAEGVVSEMILMTLRTGMRQGEIKGLQWSSVDWQSRGIVIRHSYCDVRKVLDTPKSNRERYIPLDVDLYEMLYKRKQSTGYVFLDGRQPFNSPRLNLRLAKVCESAGIRKITWHALRHTFASQLAMGGAPLNVVQTLLGHVSIATTMRYAHVAPSALRSAIETLNPKTAINANFWAIRGQPAIPLAMKSEEVSDNSGGR
jgi:integrase